MSIEALLTEVKRQNEVKRDLVASTQQNVRMVPMPEFSDGVALVAVQPSGDLDRFEITDNCHRQIAGRLNIPWKHYGRLLTDHKDLVMGEVNALFEREPATRMIRTLDGKARAFLSDKFLPIDNVDTLEATLPPLVKGEVSNKLLSSHVDDDKLYLKVLFDDSRLTQRIGTTRDGKADTVHPGIVISNSETGKGAFSISGFFYRDFCWNGCVFGKEEAFGYTRRHVGAKLDIGDVVFSEDTRRKQRDLIVAEMADALRAFTSPDTVQKMGDKLRALKERRPVDEPVAAVELLVKEIPDLREADKSSILENFIRDQDYSQWGMVNAVTELANSDEIEYERACELEKLGAKIIDFSATQWDRYAMAVAA
jgi:hypothetical protein